FAQGVDRVVVERVQLSRSVERQHRQLGIPRHVEAGPRPVHRRPGQRDPVGSYAHAPLTLLSWPSQCGARSTRRWTFPVGEIGSGSVVSSTRPGFWCVPSAAATLATISTSDTVAAGSTTQTAIGVSPHLGCGTPKTATASTCGCPAMIVSNSAGEMLNPPETIMSS